jgi:hypothetical protein
MRTLDHKSLDDSAFDHSSVRTGSLLAAEDFQGGKSGSQLHLLFQHVPIASHCRRNDATFQHAFSQVNVD